MKKLFKGYEDMLKDVNETTLFALACMTKVGF